jgi:DNA-binding SARP family transcriptional activator/tetratricopeptide (TPR) repeat protein
MLTVAMGGLIEREGVTARIIAALDGGSVLVIAGAGYGKTTALRAALARGGLLAAWVRCGEAGSDAGRLLGLIVDAVCAAAPGAADAFAEQLAAARQPVDPERAAAALERELASLLVEPLVIVFDDAEAISGAPAATDMIARLLATESRLLRIALASRTRLTLRVARQRATGRMIEIGPPELAFSASECADCLRLAGRQNAGPSAVEALLAATAGWPLGVALAASSSDVAGVGPSPALARDYFAEEVFAPLDSNLQHALLAASSAPDLELAELAGLAPEGGFGAAIDRHGLFVGSYDRPGSTEFHPLFRDFLLARFTADTPPGDQRSVARQIATALDGCGRGTEAIAFHLSGEDWETAAAAIVREGPALVRTAADTVAGWIADLPAEAADSPELMLLGGELAHGRGRFDEAITLCGKAVERFDEVAAPPSRRFAARFALADVLMAVGDLAGVAALSTVLEQPDAAGELAARAVGVVAAAGIARQGRFDEGREVFFRALNDPCAQPLAPIAPVFEGYYLELPAGWLDDALRHAREGVAMLEVADPAGRLPYALAYLMSILEERGDDDEALAVAEQARARARREGLSGWVGVVIAIRCASLRARAGDASGAEAELAEVTPGWRVWGAWELDAARAAIAALRGDVRGTLAAADRAMVEAEQRWPYFDRARCAALLAPALSNCGYPWRAREIVESTIASSPPGFSTARLCSLLACLLHDEGDEAGSLRAITAAWSQAGDQIKHAVRREWPLIERPMWVALEHGAIDVESSIDALAAAVPGGAALAGFTRHPVPAVRRAALLGALAGGHPAGIERLQELVNDPDETVASAARVATDHLRRSPPALSFRLLGGFELRRGAWLVEDAAWERRVAQRVVRVLLCRGGGAVTEDELIDAIWPDASPQSARRSVQVAVSAARAVLDQPGAQHSRLVCSERTYRLRLGAGDRVDAEDFERAAVAALRSEAVNPRGALVAAAALWAGEPLPEERYSEWATTWRERLIDRYSELLGALSDAHQQAGDLTGAVDVARRLVELDPLNESAHRRLIVAFARTGRRGHALRQFLECRRTLVTTLGIEPGDESAALQRRLLAGEPV